MVESRIHSDISGPVQSYKGKGSIMDTLTKVNAGVRDGSRVSSKGSVIEMEGVRNFWTLKSIMVYMCDSSISIVLFGVFHGIQVTITWF